jgi:cell division protein ZapA
LATGISRRISMTPWQIFSLVLAQPGWELPMSNPENLIRVEIFDHFYQIRAGVEGEYLQQLAAYVDRKMREVAQGLKTVDNLKIAVMAALNIADELHQEKEKARRLDTLVYDKSLECTRQLDQALKSK